MNKLKVALAVTGMTAGMVTTAFAGTWVQGAGANSGKWWYATNADGSQYCHASGTTPDWQWIDGKCYAFDANGWMYANTTTPDNYTVNVNGEWVKDGVVQTNAAAAKIPMTTDLQKMQTFFQFLRCLGEGKGIDITDFNKLSDEDKKFVLRGIIGSIDQDSKYGFTEYKYYTYISRDAMNVLLINAVNSTNNAGAIKIYAQESGETDDSGRYKILVGDWGDYEPITNLTGIKALSDGTFEVDGQSYWEDFTDDKADKEYRNFRAVIKKNELSALDGYTVISFVYS